MAEPGEGFYPYQAPIDAYGNGGFRFAEMSHRGSLLCLPTGMHAWEVTTAADITLQSLAPVLAAADAVDVLLIGLGHDIARDRSGNPGRLARAQGDRRGASAPAARCAPTMCCWASSARSGRR